MNETARKILLFLFKGKKVKCFVVCFAFFFLFDVRCLLLHECYANDVKTV